MIASPTAPIRVTSKGFWVGSSVAKESCSWNTPFLLASSWTLKLTTPPAGTDVKSSSCVKFVSCGSPRVNRRLPRLLISNSRTTAEFRSVLPKSTVLAPSANSTLPPPVTSRTSTRGLTNCSRRIASAIT